jgi:hypothetical protein
MADYILLGGARKNVGDFLIGERGVQLLAHYRPDRTREVWDRFVPLDARLDAVNRSRAVILLGGPAYESDFYPSIYPLTRPLEKIRVPIIPMALGWGGQPAGDWTRFAFTPRSVEALRWMHSRIPASSCRDVVTRELIQRHGVANVVMTGCTAWHHVPSLGQPFQARREVETVVVTAGARRQWYGQNVTLLEHVRQRFPAARRYCVFHRGIGWDRHTSIPNALFHRCLAARARRLGYEVIDAAYDLRKIDFYHQCDLHIGYRLHAHLFFLSIRRPSFLIQEDGRGVGATLSLGTPDVAASEDAPVAALMRAIDGALEDRFRAFASVAARLDEAHGVMRDFIRGLP